MIEQLAKLARDHDLDHRAGSRGEALFSRDGRERFALARDLAGGAGGQLLCGTILWVGLNPSVAGAETDDPTVRREAAFSRRWGFARYVKANACSRVSTDPHGAVFDEQIAQINGVILDALAGSSDSIVVAWGAGIELFASGADEADLTTKLRLNHRWRTLVCLGTTRDGHPRHPLYLRADTTPIFFGASLDGVRVDFDRGRAILARTQEAS